MESRPYRVVIVGGGAAGLDVAARLRRADRHLDIAVIEPSPTHYYQPLWTLVGAGILPKRATARSEASLIPRGVSWIQDRVEAFAPDAHAVATTGAGRIGYDALVVCPGIHIDWSRIRGLPQALGKDGVCSNYAYDTVDKTWEFLRSFDGGTAVFTMPSTAIKCGGAPQKIMWLAEDYFTRHRLRDRTTVIFASAGTRIFGVEKYRRTLERLVEERHIETRWHHDLIEVRPPSREAVFRVGGTGEDVIRYDLLHVAPPMSAPDCVARSPLADPSGWVDVDRHTLQHRRYPDVFSLGDASSLPTSKTGAAVRKQAPVLVKNLLAAMRGEDLPARYSGYTSCPLVTRYGRVVLAEFDYDGNPAETFPFDQSVERRSMYWLKRYILPGLYWHGMLRGRA